MTLDEMFPCPGCGSDDIYCKPVGFTYGCRSCNYFWGHPQAIAESGQTSAELLYDWKYPNN
jgi:hypothetical protein